MSSLFNESALNALIESQPESFKQVVRTYVGEAKFFFALLSHDLAQREDVQNIVEVGAGIGLLSLLLAEQGYSVVAFEPEAAGFGEMRRIRDFILKSWSGPLPDVQFVYGYLTESHHDGSCLADFGFAINVIEHVPKTAEFMAICNSAVGVGREFRFVCPNYIFPYEPHFNFLTLFTKRATWRLRRRAIEGSELPNPIGMWTELSWITPRKLTRAAKEYGLTISFSRSAMKAYNNRPLTDAMFIERKGNFGKVILLPLSRLLSVIVTIVPTFLLPILDVSVQRCDAVERR